MWTGVEPPGVQGELRAEGPAPPPPTPGICLEGNEGGGGREAKKIAQGELGKGYPDA